MGSTPEPAELVRQAKAGDARAFGQLYELYFTPVYRYIYIRVNDKVLTEDLTQTVFMKVYQTIGRFEVRSVSPLAYFFTVARNTVIDHWKRRREIRFSDVESDAEPFAEVADGSVDIAVAVDRSVTADLLTDALATLSDEQRDMLSLKFLGGLSTKEIATVMGKREDAVRQLQSRGLRALRGKLSHLRHLLSS